MKPKNEAVLPQLGRTGWRPNVSE